MSYETNPITNRLKIAKGWKNPYFPSQSLNYSREMLLWFKVYLFLKAYLSFQQIRLLACEIRVTEKNTKILYLSVNKDRREQKKNAKSKWRSKSFLYALRSPLIKVSTQDARFLLYQDFKSLKKTSAWNVNFSQKKIISKAWLTKNRNLSWVNTAYLISKSRNQFKSKQQRYRKQKEFGRSLIFQAKTVEFHSEFKNEKILKHKFWKNKQRQVFSIFAKIQKEVFFIEKILNILPGLISDQKPKNLLENLIAQYEEKKQILSKLKKIYNFSFHSNIQLQKQEKAAITRLIFKIRKQQTRTKLKFFWFNLKKELTLLKKQSLFFKNKPQYFLIWRKKLWKASRFCIPTNLKLRNTILSLYLLYGPKTKNIIESMNNQFFSSNQKNYYLMKYIFKGFFLAQPSFQNQKQLSKENRVLLQGGSSFFDLKQQKKTNLYNNKNFNSFMTSIWKKKRISLTKTRMFTKKKKLFPWQTLRLVQFNQKTPQKLFSQKMTKKLQPLVKKKSVFRRRKKTSFKEKFKYRVPYRREYKNKLKLFTNWKLKYLIQDFVQKYFAIRLYVKLLWPLAEFKNLKFYRLVFPKKRSSKNKRVSILTKIYTKQVLLRKRYVFISQVTNHVRLKNSYQREKKQRIFLKRIKKVLGLPFVKNSKKKGNNLVSLVSRSNLRILNKNKYKKSGNTLSFLLRKDMLTYKVAPNTWTLKSPKKNAYLSRKLKMLQVQGQKRLHWAAKARFMSNLVTTLTLFAKYLDPQPLADILAKVIGNTKKHVSTLKLVETVLRTLNFKRCVGYRIGLTGRANGADKSHVMYLRKLNRNRPRQTFSKNVNFAMAQARATIGAFGIKIWVYY